VGAYTGETSLSMVRLPTTPVCIWFLPNKKSNPPVLKCAIAPF
jgi:hypothetical protein